MGKGAGRKLVVAHWRGLRGASECQRGGRDNQFGDHASPPYRARRGSDAGVLVVPPFYSIALAAKAGPRAHSAAARLLAGLVQRSAAESSDDLASTQFAPAGRSTRFQNGAWVLR